MRLLTKALIGAFSFALVSTPVVAQEVIQFGVGLYQPDKDKNDATYTPLAQYLEKKTGQACKAAHGEQLGRFGKIAGQW